MKELNQVKEKETVSECSQLHPEYYLLVELASWGLVMSLDDPEDLLESTGESGDVLLEESDALKGSFSRFEKEE